MQASDDPVVVAYLDELLEALPAGRRTRAAIRAELSDGLACAIDARVERGEDPHAAAEAAVTEFGEPRALARDFARELAAESAHRIGLGLVGAGPFVGLLWVAASPAAPGAGWLTRIVTALSAMPVYPVLLALVVPAAVVAIVASRRSDRLGVGLAAGAAQVAALGCVAGDVSLLMAIHGETLGFVAAAASAARLTVVLLAGRRVARLRAAAG
jgi:hypothetical protein